MLTDFLRYRCSLRESSILRNCCQNPTREKQSGLFPILVSAGCDDTTKDKWVWKSSLRCVLVLVGHVCKSWKQEPLQCWVKICSLSFFTPSVYLIWKKRELNLLPVVPCPSEEGGTWEGDAVVSLALCCGHCCSSQVHIKDNTVF